MKLKILVRNTIVSLFVLFFSTKSEAQDLNYIGGNFPTKSINDTLTLNTFFLFHKLFFAANNQRALRYIDTLFYKSDTTAFNGTLRIHMWSAMITDTVIESATLYYSFEQGVQRNSYSEFYCYDAWDEKGDTLLIYPQSLRDHRPYNIKPPSHISEKRICRTE